MGLQAEARKAAQEAEEEGEDGNNEAKAGADGTASAPPQRERAAPVAFGVPQLVVNEETGEVEERVVEAPQVLSTSKL